VALVTLAAAKAQLNIDVGDASHDDELQLYVDAVTTPVEKAVGRVVDQRQFTDERDLAGATSVLLPNVPVIEVTDVATIDGATTWDPADLHVNSASGRVTVRSGPPLTGLVAFTYTAGPATAAPNEQLAALLIIQHLWETKRGTMVVNTGGDMEPWAPGMGFAVPHRALELLGDPLPGIA
jgi:hypothetical protein